MDFTLTLIELLKGKEKRDEVNRQLVRAAGCALTTAAIELAGRVITGVASDALGGEYRLDITLIREGFGARSGEREE